MKYSNLIINSRANSGVTFLLFLWLSFGLTYVLPNHGGIGLNLPQNLLTWTFMALTSLWCSYFFPFGKKITLPAGSWLLIAGVILWSLPLLWSPRADWRLNALPKVIALWGMVAFYFVLLCTTSCNRLRSRWLLILVLAALTQTVYGFWQFSHIQELTGGRPYGSFQQVNVLASFIATGLVCALWLFLQNNSRRIRILTASALVILPAILVILQSRAGELGAACGIFLLLITVVRHKKNRTLDAVLLLVAGVAMGVIMLHLSQYLFPGLISVIDKQGSTLARLYILKLTWVLIEQHPIVGNGYGSFEALYGQLAQMIPPGLEAPTMQYPHNEFLYTWVEGGIVAVTGLLLIVTGMFVRMWGQGGARFVGVALLLPVAIHMNLEYPLYQSMTHGLVVVMLLLICGPAAQKVSVAATTGVPYWNPIKRGMLLMMSLFVLIFMITGLQTQQKITLIEQQGLLPLAFDEQTVMASLQNPLSQSTRIDFDRHVALLLKFNMTHDPLLLKQYSEWADGYLQVHNDPSVYASLLMIARAKRLPSAEVICRKAKGRWLSDQRFICRV